MRGRDLAVWVLLAATWGASYLWIRIAAPAIGAFPLMAARVAIAAVVLWAVARLRGERLALRAHARPLFVLGLLHAAAPYALIATAERHVNASTTAVLMAVQPLWTAMLSAAWFREPTTPRLYAGLALGVVGVAALVGWRPDAAGGPPWPAVLALLVASGLYAAGSLFARHRLHDVPGTSMALGQQLGALVWLAVPAALQWPRVAPPPHVFAAVAILAVVSTAFATVLFFGLIRRLGALRVSTVTYAIPVFGVLWGSLFLGERPTPGLLVGLGITFASLVIVNGRVPAGLRAALRRRSAHPGWARRGRSPGTC